MRKKPFHVRLTVETIDAARELTARFGFEYHSQPAIGLFLEFAIDCFKKVVQGRYKWYDTETEIFVDLAEVAEQFRDSNSNPNN
jgi:hypothetical protein